MCGIFGAFNPSGSIASRTGLSATQVLRHRGPDALGVLAEVAAGQPPLVLWNLDAAPSSETDLPEFCRLFLGHRRLSIVDLSENGAQPMGTPDGAVWIVFNGEIYNYQDLRLELSGAYTFRSSSDTEVILAAYRKWGEGCVEKLQGMFAFCIYDRAAQRLFLARDRAGEKPLFYFHSRERFAFASELKALWQDPGIPRRIDPAMLQFYLAFGYVPAPHCMAKGLSKLPAGHAMSLNMQGGNLRVWRYWDLPGPDTGVARNDDELTQELERLLTDSVRRQLVADVPVGVLLSGGLDSSILAALAARASKSTIRTFTITFPGFREYDEGPFAKKVASHIGSDHRELVAESSSVDLLKVLARQFDEPMGDSSMVPTHLVSKLIREHAKVAVGGDGGDELFGGYMHYSRAQQQEVLIRRLPAAARALVSGAASRLLPIGFRGRNYFLSLERDLSWNLAHLNVHFDHRTRSRLLRCREDDAPERYKMNLFDPARGLPGQLMAADFKSYLCEDILVKVDRASMLASLEVRAPFLDHRLIEFAFSRVPNASRATPTSRKILLRRLARKLLPADVDWTRKQGFSIPLHQWIRGEWGAFFKSVLLDPGNDIFDHKVVGRLFTNQSRLCSNTERLFALTMFVLWRKTYHCGLA